MDAYSSYTCINFLKTQGDALSAFTVFQKYVKTQFQRIIKSVQSNFGGDFIPFTKLLNAQVILHKLTVLTHHIKMARLKGNIDIYRYIVELCLTFLAHRAMSITYWDHSFTTTVYLMNRLPNGGLPEF